MSQDYAPSVTLRGCMCPKDRVFALQLAERLMPQLTLAPGVRIRAEVWGGHTFEAHWTRAANIIVRRVR